MLRVMMMMLLMGGVGEKGGVDVCGVGEGEIDELARFDAREVELLFVEVC